MDVVIDLVDVPQRQRGERWAETIRGEYLEVDIRFPGLAYPTGKIARAWAGGVSMSSFHGSRQLHERTRAMAGDDGIDWLMGALQLEGRSHIVQRGRDTDLAPGQLMLFDAADACRIDFQDDHHVVFLTIPRVFFPEKSCRVRDYLNIRVDEACGSNLIITYFEHIMTRCHELTARQRADMGSLGVALLVSAAAASAGLGAGPMITSRSLVFD